MSSIAPPHAVDAEQALLGSLLLNNKLFDVVDHLRGEHFYDKRNAVIYDTLKKMIAAGAVDPVLLSKQLDDEKKLRAAGGSEYIADVADCGASAVNVAAYVELVADMAQRRQVITILSEAQAAAYAPGDAKSSQLIDEIEQRLSEVQNEFAQQGTALRDAGVVAGQHLDKITDIIARDAFEELIGVPTGISRLDKMTSGLHGGDLIIVAARPGAGKTAFALNLARHATATGGGAVFFSLEMSAELLARRLVSQDGVPLSALRTGKGADGKPIDGDMIRAFAEGVGALEGRGVWIDDRSGITVLQARAQARRVRRLLAAENKKLSLIVVDYLLAHTRVYR